MGVFETARQLLDAGIGVIPAVYKDKRPALASWEKYQREPASHLQVEKWFGGRTERNVLVVCGRVSRLLVLDLDNKQAGKWWRQLPGMNEAMDATTCVKTAKGYHFWFRLEDGESFPSVQVTEEDRKFDLKCEGGLVIGPGSVHETGRPYSWVRGLADLQPLPDAIRGFYEMREQEDGAQVRSLFVDLLRAIPEAEGEGRNDWLARVAGHLAKWIPHRDAYEAMVYFVNDALPEPLDEEDEVDKLVRSVWKGHQQRHKPENSDRDASIETGWLEGNGRQLITTVKIKDDEVLAPWSNFDIQVISVIHSGEESSYRIELLRESGESEELLVDAEVFLNPNMLNKWLANHRLIVYTLPGDKWARNFRPTQRLHSYVASQNAPLCEVTDHLGWVSNIGFVTHEGLLTRDGFLQHDRLVPDPKLRNWAPYRYGLVDEEEARGVLREVMTFQDETVCAVFGAWWAACWLKAQIMQQAALFPFMAIEAASGTGKTNGFFSLMIQMNGNTVAQGRPTGASLRDAISAHQNGINWIDDLDDANDVMNLLREATSEGTRTKKGQDRTTQELVKLRGAIVISGEGFDGLQTEKAQRERAVILHVGSPTDRMSQKDPERIQYDDILDLQERYGAGDTPLNAVAGTLGGLFLDCADMVPQLKSLRVGTGRVGDKLAILRLGARMLARVTEEEKWVEIVDQWVQDVPDYGEHNDLTMKILPKFLMSAGVQHTPTGGPAVYVDTKGIVWFHEEKVATEYPRMLGKGDRAQLGGVESIRSQRKALGIEGVGVLKTTHTAQQHGARVVSRYHACPEEVSARVLAQAGMLVESSDGNTTLPGV